MRTVELTKEVDGKIITSNMEFDKISFYHAEKYDDEDGYYGILFSGVGGEIFVEIDFDKGFEKFLWNNKFKKEWECNVYRNEKDYWTVMDKYIDAFRTVYERFITKEYFIPICKKKKYYILVDEFIDKIYNDNFINDKFTIRDIEQEVK